MYKKVLISLVAFALVASMLPVWAAEAGTGSLDASGVWHYSGYRVEQLDFGAEEVEGPYSIGDHVIIAAVSDGCALSGCDRRDLYIVKNGGYISVPNVPASSLDEATYWANDKRFIWIDKTDLDSARYDIVELDPFTGEKETLLKDIFISGAEEVIARASGDEYYFNPTFNFNNHEGFKQAAVYRYNPESGLIDIVTKHWKLNHEEVMDAHEGMLLTKMTFESGETQLWLYGDGLWPYAIPDTWTVDHEEIVGAHFREDGSIEFFRMYERYVWTPDDEGGITSATGEYLSWYRNREDALQIVGNKMAWLDPDGILRVSTAEGEINLGTIGPTGIFRLEEDRIFYDADGTGRVYDFETALEEEIPFVATDSYGDTVVGIDVIGNVMYYNARTGNVFSLGYGSTPFVSDESHVYWLGADGNVYEATLNPESLVSSSLVDAVKTSDGSTVYLIDGNTRYTFANPATFFTWFDDFSAVTEISQAELNEYADGGEARFAPGSRVKLVGDPKVYTVGEDGKLHWIISQAVAYLIWGADWNQNIVTVTLEDLVDYGFGTSIASEADVNVI